MPVAPNPPDVSTLRGPEAQHIGGRFWSVVCVLVFIVIAIFIVVSFIAAVNDNARIDRLRTNGIPVVVTVTSCTGHIGGSGSNAAGYTCYGWYRVHGVRYQEVIGSKTTSSPTGSNVRVIADPSQPGTIELASAVAASSSSDSTFVVPSILAVLFVTLSLVVVRARRTRSKPLVERRN
jgi:hypothetical protein